MTSKSAKDFLPKKINLTSLRKAAQNCEGCHLFKQAHHTVFGEGPARAKLVMVGEIAGDKEDQLARPFVGPAGVFLRKLIAEADLDINKIYFTNVVKHFKFKQVQQRRLHRSPVAKEIKAC
jgi:uracil-DNA glycosylase family 4